MRGETRSSRFVVRAAMDAFGAQAMCAGGGRSSRVVLSPRRWGQANGDDPFATVANKPETPGRARSSRKEPSCRECRTVRRPVVTMLVGRLPFSAHEAAGAAGARHSLRPLSFEGHGFSHHSDAICAAGMMMAVCNSNQMAPAIPDHLAPPAGRGRHRAKRECRVRGMARHHRDFAVSDSKKCLRLTQTQFAEAPPHPKPPLRVGHSRGFASAFLRTAAEGGLRSPRTRGEVQQAARHPALS
jgi:hypothetical protein